MSVKIPKGFVRAPAGHVLRGDHTDILYGAAGEPYQNSRVWVWVSGIAGESCDHNGKCRYHLCAIPAPAKVEPVKEEPVKDAGEAVKCPACGCVMFYYSMFWSCQNTNCEMCNRSFSLGFIKRITIAPEPPACPACGNGTTVSCYGDNCFCGCINKKCAVAGPFAKTPDEAREMFRRLSYRKDTP